MWPMIAVAGIAAAGNYLSNMSAEERAEAARNRALQEFVGINIPDPALQRLALERFVSEGTLVPQLERAIRQNPSAFDKIMVSSEQKSAQNRALRELENIGYSGGLRLQDRAALQDAQMESQITDRSNRAAILDDMARRGQSGAGGMAMQAQLQGQQATGDRNARSALSTAASAQDRALQAIMGAGEMATGMRTQDFSEQAERAKATDAIDRFNTMNMQDVQMRNVGSQNRANERNLDERQRLSDANVGMRNDEQRYNKELMQRHFENQMAMAGAKSGVYTGMGQDAIRSGEKQGNMWSNLGNAGVGVASNEYANDRAESRERDRRAWDEDMYKKYGKRY